MTSNEQDIDLLRRIHEKDKHAEKELAEKYRDRIQLYFINKRLPKADLEDLVQEVMLIILQQAQVGAIGLLQSNFRKYCLGICRNKFCEYLRNKYKGKSLIHLDHSPASDLPANDFAISEEISIFDEDDERRRMDIIVRLFEELQPSEQDALRDYWINEMSSKAVGKKYQMSDMALRKLASRARKRVHEQALAAFKKLVTILIILTLLIRTWNG